MKRPRIAVLVVMASFMFVPACLAGEKQAEAVTGPVNRVDISEFLSTSGQPAEGFFGELADEGFEMVINLAPPQSHGSLQDEGGLVAGRGLIYVNIPVDWDHPDPALFEFFGKLLGDNPTRKTLVHCQVGFRASTFTFLYRVIYQKLSADDALEAVHQVWVPNDTWSVFANQVLADNGSDFELPVD